MWHIARLRHSWTLVRPTSIRYYIDICSSGRFVNVEYRIIWQLVHFVPDWLKKNSELNAVHHLTKVSKLKPLNSSICRYPLRSGKSVLISKRIFCKAIYPTLMINDFFMKSYKSFIVNVANILNCYMDKILCNVFVKTKSPLCIKCDLVKKLLYNNVYHALRQ